MRNKGFTLIELLVVILIIGILLALIIPNFVLFQERARRSSVKNNMHVVQTALEAYAVDHYGNYPNEDVVWDDATDEGSISLWFPGGDPIGIEGEPKPGNFPVNPYDGKRYNSDEKDEMDLDYEEYYGELEPGLNAQKRGDDDECPYIDFGEVPEYPGGIGIATYLMDIGYEAPLEYGIYGFGRDITYPMYDLDPMADDPTDEEYWIFFVLHN
jgi:prepilin-type N-terminal cleavage/methylation domain-containing protein